MSIQDIFEEGDTGEAILPVPVSAIAARLRADRDGSEAPKVNGTGADRAQRYAEAILDNFHGPNRLHSTWWLNTDEMGAAVMAVADAELDATKRSLDWHFYARAEAEAEALRLQAQVARVEAALSEWDHRGTTGADDSPADRQSRLGIRQAVRAIRAALGDS